MRYVIAILVHCLSMLFQGKDFYAIICYILQVTLIGWIPAAIWAVMSVSDERADERMNKIIESKPLLLKQKKYETH